MSLKNAYPSVLCLGGGGISQRLVQMWNNINHNEISLQDQSQYSDCARPNLMTTQSIRKTMLILWQHS